MAYKINKGYIVQKVGENTTIFDSEESVMYTFNETASFIFSQLKRNIPEDLIVKKLEEKFAVDFSQAEKDVDEFIKDLLIKKIVVVSS